MACLLIFQVGNGEEHPARWRLVQRRQRQAAAQRRGHLRAHRVAHLLRRSRGGAQGTGVGLRTGLQAYNARVQAECRAVTAGVQQGGGLYGKGWAGQCPERASAGAGCSRPTQPPTSLFPPTWKRCVSAGLRMNRVEVLGLASSTW